MALIEGCRHEVSITIPVVDVESETAKVLKEFQKKASMPGFRPGKVPVSMVRQRFAGDIRQHVLEHLVPHALQERFKQENLNVVGQPEVKDLKFEEGQPVEFKASFEVAPEFELGEYAGIEAPWSEPQATDDEIGKRIEEVRNQKAEYVNLDPRPAESGDFAVISLESISGAEPPVKSDEMIVELGGADTMPAFTENLIGATPGDTREFDVTYPEDYGQEKLAGKTVRFSVHLKQLRKRELPEVNEEFAKDLGDFKSLEELREEVRRGIQREKEHHAQETAKSAIIDKLVDAHEFPVPEAFVNRQLEIQAENYLRTLAAQGVDIQNIKLDWEKLKESQKDRAVRDVRASLLLEKVADREAIGATQEEVDREVQRIARSAKEAPAAVRMRLEKDGTLSRIASRIRTEKTLGFLFDKSRKVAPPEKSE